ncbi:ATP-binding protein [Bdellovibrio sp. HCB337]|uniref:ATP-binding protein n=1 Tax=Bdellovibrio sp. HCB337 TaxID=3394358 RepID=UPI0039A5F4CA
MSGSKASLQKNVVYSLFWSFALVLGAGFIFHLANLRKEALESAKIDTYNVASALKENTLRQIDKAHALLKSRLETPSFQQAFASRSEQALFDQLQKMDMEQEPNGEFIVIDAQGNLLSSSMGIPAKPENFSEVPFFQFHSEDTSKQIKVGDIYKGPHRQIYKIPLSIRVSKPDGSFSGVIAVLMDPRSVQSFYKTIDLKLGDSMALIDSEGRYMTRFPWKDNIVGEVRTRYPDIVSAIYNNPRGTVIGPSSVDGQERVISFSKFERYPVTAAAARLTSVVYKTVWTSAYLLVPLYVGLVWLAFYLSRAFLRSEFRLRNEIEKAELFEHTVKAINSRTSKEIGQKFLDKLVIEIGKVLRCRYVFVGEVAKDRQRVVTIAASKDGEPIPNVEYDIENTPCEGVLREEICYFSKGVQHLFPKDHMLTQIGAESYLGVSLFDSRGDILGILVGLHDSPMEDSDLVTTVFSIFAARAGAEIERIRSERSRQETEDMKRHLESQVAHSQKMESIGRLASGIAHDFNNVLGAITANLEFARMRAGEKSPATEYINRADKASLRARDLVRQILTFGRKGQQDENKPLSLAQIIQEVGQILRAGIGAHIEIRTIILDYDMTIFANATQIHQVLMNLCTNAAQAITKSSGLIEIILERENGEAKLTVRDNGVGIDSETLPRIFEPFFTTKGAGQGTGLGLSVVQNIVKNHGGHIEVKSIPLEGSEFVLYFPLFMKEKIEVPVTDLSSLPQGHGQEILVVDDESTMVELTCDILNDNGYKTTGFSYPQEAYKAFMENPAKYSLVVTDITMPGMRGEELARRIREVRKDIPVIFTTGLDTELNQLQSVEGPYLTLQKPYNLWTLVDAVGRFLKTKTPGQPTV